MDLQKLDMDVQTVELKCYVDLNKCGADLPNVV